LELPKERPSLEESYNNTLEQFSLGMDVLTILSERFEKLQNQKMKRGKDKELANIISGMLILMTATTESLGRNWRTTYLLRDIAFDQNELLQKMVNKMESQAVSDDDKKDVLNLKHSFKETQKQFESIRAQYDVTKHKADNAEQVANEARQKTTKFDKLEPLLDRINELLQEKGGNIE